MAGLVGGRNDTSTVNNLINARSVFLILGSKRGRLIDRKRLKERGVYSHNCSKLNKTNMLSAPLERV